MPMTRPPAEVAAEALPETAVERNNDDGSIDVLVALRVKVSNTETQNRQTGYRLRVKMTPADGRYKFSKLDQVAK
jgi:Mce-associated membrane protein